ncbi:hypothetical protein FO519_005551 [Halicephalobus sp. NKZ332]|nr:hypothetical protein FO519_005551 [Halicephalobus sp. NKZ332]
MPALTIKSLINIVTNGTKTVDKAIHKGSSKIRPKSKSVPSTSKKQNGPEIHLPDDIWDKICDGLSPFDQLKLRRVNKQLNSVVEKRLQKTIYLDVVKCELNEVLPDHEQNDGEFYRHRKHNILLNINDRSIALVVDDRWTSRDVHYVFAAIKALGKYSRCVTIDSQIAELIIVGLSSLKLSRWHAFECYIQAVGPVVADELHMKPSKSSPSSCKTVFFPKAKEITVRVLISDLGHLSRIQDYGVPSCSLFDYHQLDMLRINVVDNSVQCRGEMGSSIRYVKRPHKHLNIFKKWARSSELREKYVQQYS